MIITVVLGVTAEYPSILKLYPYNSRHSLYIIQNGKPDPKFVALLAEYVINKIEQTRPCVVDPQYFSKVETVFRLPDGFNLQSFIPFHPQYHGVSMDIFNISTIPIIYHNNRIMGGPGNQNSDRSDREKWSTSKDGPVFLFRLDQSDPLSFRPKFLEILVKSGSRLMLKGNVTKRT